jgi:hypothetical protein
MLLAMEFIIVEVVGVADAILCFMNPTYSIRWHAVAQLVETLLYKPEGSGFDSRWCHWIVRLSALRIGRLYATGNILGTLLCSRLSRPQGHSATERICQ